MNGFIGVKKVSSLDELKELIDKFANDLSYYFVRYSHTVSGIDRNKPNNFPGREGQIFNALRELRWQQQGSGYQLLLLTQRKTDLNEGWNRIYGSWKIYERHAYFYDQDETKFPQEFIFKDINGKNINPKTIPIRQRYFQDTNTATIHFVALSLETNNGKI